MNTIKRKHVNLSKDKLDRIYTKEMVSISKNAGLSASSLTVSYLISYVSVILITRFVGEQIYGIFCIANTILGITVLFSMFGLNQGILRFVSYYSGKNDLARIKGTILFGFKTTSFLSIAITILIFLLSPYIASNFFHEPNLSLAIRILIIALPFFVAMEIYLASLQGLKLIPQNTLVKNIIQPCVRLVLLLILFLLGFKLLGILYATIISIILGSVAAYLFLKKNCSSFRDQTMAIYEKSEIMKFSTPLFFEGLLNFLINSLPILILGYFRSSAEVGIYGIGLRLGLLVSLPLLSFNTIFAPTISNLYGRGEKESLAHLFKTITKWVFTISLAIFLIIILFAKPILSVFGKTFIVGATALYFIVFGELVNTAVGSVGYMLKMTGRSKMNLMNSLILCCTTVVLGLLLIPKYGILGAGLSTAISVTLINILRLIEVYYFEHIHPYNINFAKPIIAGVISVFVIMAIKYLIPNNHVIYTLLTILIFGFIFITSLILLKLELDDIFIIKLLGEKIKYN